MRYEISEKAQQDLINIETYLLEEWDVGVLEDFFEEFQKAIILLLERKAIFQKYEDTNFHRFLLTKHNSIIYHYGEDVLYIHRILQNFQDPDDNYKRLKP